ncbi:hypothetical protein EHI8A_241820 [Entamoeba histolytica HM-1:IMSS-B]|uniref:AATF leucine zipper-containing domain-containing protein n=5 Tax=Entamoeba histolytica TaxID=5759 RepID=C4LW50_ENTH1|nr:hypothetical protein EHI_142050 [Entamoeba histolytica HM-1:IMSS]EMD45674.1 protein bfr2, putative [Entamoeba histolytica KU27]EMH77135.1 hypothetical protein EHI8A_241820 [Entamoeba histolytica HM-1:IMSS-B]EMS14331.1 protein bfr2, putative [Entamoeba histolytica HM-3:IMSS]GAT92923.1 hypothetical protein CL6EHI_142050 [Entamoeba histolytica]EAL43186.1 hypothetical protein EHI_142050 [Entamoeba histolytica HM-1:IMSS]|eukprot:XP_648572.1 hypothetical protein EHI_142050 [Entamoeba histolytica HM-1:IMSS]
MSRREEIEKAINELIGQPKEFGEEEIDKAKIENDEELKMKDSFTVGKIKAAQGIEEDKNWEGKIVNKEDVFNNFSKSNEESEEDNSMSEEDAENSEENKESNEEDNSMSEEDEEESNENKESNEEGEEDEADKLIQQTLNVETIQKKTNDVEKEDVSNQIKLFDTALDIRVKMQGILGDVNSLPLSEDIKMLRENNERFKEELESLNSSFKNLFHRTTELCETIDKQWGVQWEYKSTDNDEEKLMKVNKKKDEQRLSIMEKWHSKTTMMNISKFSTNQNGIVQQVNAILKDQERLFRRSQQLRGTKIYLNEDLISSSEVFDDGDFYQQLIKDAVDYGITGKGQPMMNNTKKQIQKKKKRVNTDIVFPKLENFKCPVEYNEKLMEVDRSIFIKNLFK